MTSPQPSPLLYLTDPARAVVDFGLLTSSAPLLAALPRGDGHPVLVLPGLGASDSSTIMLRAVLRWLGYRTYGWRLGRNLGPTARAVEGMPARLNQLTKRFGGPVSLIGWSLGGIYARQLARRTVHAVRQVITLGSPIRLLEHAEEPLSVPTTSIYSPLDGIVAWRACLIEPTAQAENIAVTASHLGFGHHPAVIWAIADRLAQPAGHWTPFRPPPLLRPVYSLPERQR